MNEELSRSNPSPRERVTLFLAVIASEPCRDACHELLPPDHFSFLWCRLWFNEIYLPGPRYLDGLKGDRSEEAVARFWTSFTSVEKEALERFHRFLELRIEMLPGNLVEDESFPQTDAWDHVVRHAGYALEELESDPASLKEKVGWVARLLTKRSDRSHSASEPNLLSSLSRALNPKQLPE